VDIDPAPAKLAQIQQARNGRLVEIDDDVVGVARQLRDIDRSLRLRYCELPDGHDDYWLVYRLVEHPDGSAEEQMVTTAMELDARIVKRVQKIAAEDYDLVAELDRLDRESERARDHELHERNGPVAERLWHALRKDLAVQDRIFVPPVRRTRGHR
jgi:hypothetical protein